MLRGLGYGTFGARIGFRAFGLGVRVGSWLGVGLKTSVKDLNSTSALHSSTK